MTTILIVGSGASGVHFALSVLRKGYDVTMLDVGHTKPRPVHAEQNFNDLKEKLDDPVEYFLGRAYEAVVYPTDKDEYYTKYYGFPPSKGSIFSTPALHSFSANGFEPLFSFAQGGLAEAWTAGVYPLNDHELQAFPFDYAEIAPYYGEVARRMGIGAERDDLAQFFPYHEHLLPPLQLDPHSQLLLATYQKRKARLNRDLNCYLGRSRVGTLSQEMAGRTGCRYCGRCLWGCPTESLYTPSITLKVCQRYPNFHYVPQIYVDHFGYDANGQITQMVAYSVAEQQQRVFTADRYVLAAGALSSAKIFMESIFQQEKRTIKLTGLMDNRQILAPFINLRLIGQKYKAESYQYHQLALGLVGDEPAEYLHGQITTLKSALVHPIIQNLPVDLQTATAIFRALRASLGIINLNLFDRRRPENYVTLAPDTETGRMRLVINYTPAPTEEALIKRSLRKVKTFMLHLGCIIPPGMTHIRPMGASVHYTGTLPMSQEKLPYTTSKNCQSHDFANLYLVDGATFPFLPAKNITFSLMANAVRVAETVF